MADRYKNNPSNDHKYSAKDNAASRKRSNNHPKKNVIITACNAKYGEFLIHHWLRSLRESVDLRHIDIVVLDYGLTKEQVHALTENGVIVKKCVCDGHIVTIRYRDVADFLAKTSYDQVLSIDASDILFQADISELFSSNRDSIRAFPEAQYHLNFNGWYLRGFFDASLVDEMRTVLRGKSPINGGVVVAPRLRFIALAREVYRLVLSKHRYGPDQTALNYILYRDGFVPLKSKYNFVLVTGGDAFSIRNGVFYDENNNVIPIVHNAGGYDFARPISSFGYGSQYNQLRFFVYYPLRLLSLIWQSVRTITSKLSTNTNDN